MYGLIKLEDGVDAVAAASVALSVLEKEGISVKFAEDILELIAMAGGEVTNPEEYNEYKEAEAKAKHKYEALRQKLEYSVTAVGASPLPIEKVKASALVDIAEALTVISGINH